MAQRRKACTFLEIVERRVTVEKCATARVLTGQAYMEAFLGQRTVGHGFGETPVPRQFADAHLGAVVPDLLNARIQREAVGQLQQWIAEPFHRTRRPRDRMNVE